MNLYQISEDIQFFIDWMENHAMENDGVIPDDATGMLDSLQAEYSAKIENIALYVKNQNALSEALKTEEEALYKRRKTIDNRVEWLKSYLGNFLQDKFESARCKVSFRKSTAVEVDESRLEDSYCNIKQVKTPDKKYIKECLEAGATVDGARIVERKSVVIK
jgi:hypothetical protein